MAEKKLPQSRPSLFLYALLYIVFYVIFFYLAQWVVSFYANELTGLASYARVIATQSDVVFIARAIATALPCLIVCLCMVYWHRRAFLPGEVLGLILLSALAICLNNIWVIVSLYGLHGDFPLLTMQARFHGTIALLFLMAAVYIMANRIIYAFSRMSNYH